MRGDRLALTVGILVVTLVAVAAIVGWAAGHYTNRTKTIGSATTRAAGTSVDPKVAAGGHVFVQFACAQCHGENGRGGVSPAVPALTSAGHTCPAPI